MRNKIKEFLDSRGITPYRFRKDTGIAQRTAYDLYNNSSHYPSKEVMSKICNTYRIQPGDLLEWIPNENKESTAA